MAVLLHDVPPCGENAALDELRNRNGRDVASQHALKVVHDGANVRTVGIVSIQLVFRGV
jgi:hypothetical protein